MKGKKKWYESKTVWSGIIAVVVATLNAIMVNFNVPGLHFVLNLITSIAGAFGIYGRVVADKKIG